MLRLVWLLNFLHSFLHLFCLNNILVLCFGFLYIQNFVMASSKVEIASSASPFGCVLRDHNWRDRLSRNNRENCSNVETGFQTNIKYFVHDHHFSATISDSIPPQDAGEWLVNKEKNTTSNDTRQNDGRKRDVSPNLSDDSSIETNNMGCVSSLVQRWREFSDTKHVTKKTNSPILSNADPSIILEKSNNCHEIVPLVSAETTCDSISDKFDTPCSANFYTPSMNIKDDTSLNFEYESRTLEDGGEKEKLRVADVIRKLRLENGNGTEIKLKEQEKRCFSPVTPRFRGRQAFNDLLMQLERDRHMELDTLGERRAVSKFSHRGRIQSLLRLRFLRKDAIVRHHHQKQTHSKLIGPQNNSYSTPAPSSQQPISCEESTIVDNPQISSSNPTIIKTQKPEEIAEQEQPVSKSVAEQISQAIDSPSCQSQGSKVVLLREKFNLLDKNDPATPKTPRGVAKKYIPCIKSFSPSDLLREELHEQQEVALSARSSCSSQSSILKETEELYTSSSSDPLRKETIIEGILSERISTVSNDDVEHRDQDNCSNLQQEESYEVDNICWPESEIVSSISNGELDKRDKDKSAFLDDKNEVDNNCSSESEKIMTISNGWDGSKNSVEDDQSNQGLSNHRILENGEEWINNDVQYWSEWDEEDVSNLNWVSDIARPKSDWENLRQERYRDMLDSDQENDEMRRLLERRSVSSFLTSNLRDTMDQLMISRAERVPQSTINNHKHRVEQCEISQIQTQTNIRKEEEEEEEEGQDSNFSDQVRYPSLEQPRSSQSSCPDTQLLSGLTNRSSIDVEYMYDLRAYMEQLQHEVSELRKTVKTCMSMQEKMQCSIKQEVAIAVDLSVGRAVQGSANNNTRTRNCCLCYEMQVDSLLYRCGHMCTCFKCAHELQWSTGKCPICRAPIVDVVRAYPDSNFFGRR